MKNLLIISLMAAFAAAAAEMKKPAFGMRETELLAVLKENGLNDRVTACQELCHRGTAAAVPALAALLADKTDAPLFHAARYGLQNIPGLEAEAALAAAQKTVSDPKRRDALAASLRLRRTPVPPAYAGATAAITAVPAKTPVQNGDLAAVPALIDQALGGGFEATLARRQLVGFPNAAITDTLMEAARGADAKRARLAVGVLGDRRVRTVLPALVELSRTASDSGVRNEIHKSFATLCDPEDIPMLLGLLGENPKEDRLVGSLIRLATRACVADTVDIEILKAEYGYFGPDAVVGANGKPLAKAYADVLDMVAALVAGGSHTVMAGNRLAGHGGFAHDPAPGKMKELRLTYRVGDGPAISSVTRENGTAELAGRRLPDALAKTLVDACAAADGDLRAALVKILATLERRAAVPGADTVLFRPIFNGHDLAGWSQQDDFWSVRDGVITGESTAARPCRPNHHLVYTAETLADFELRARFRLSRGANSGIQLRCAAQYVGDNGYQADMDGGGSYVGFLYHPRQHLVGERGADVALAADGRKTVTRFADGRELQKLYRPGQWNDIRVRVAGRTITVWINGVRTTSVDDAREAFLPSSGHLALQLHQGPPMKVEFRDLRIR